MLLFVLRGEQPLCMEEGHSCSIPLADPPTGCTLHKPQGVHKERSDSGGEVLNKAKSEAMTKPDVEETGERGCQPLTPAGASLLPESLEAGNEGRTELLDFLENIHFL